jgi:DNA-binding transcriptional regulator YiaG
MRFSQKTITELGALINPQELKDIMARCKMNQIDVATYLNTSRSIVCCWINGKRRLHGSNAVLLRLLDEANTREVLAARESQNIAVSA